MLVSYFYIILVVSLLNLTNIQFKQKLFWGLIVIGIVISGFRNMGGLDFIAYKEYYQNPEYGYEIGYVWLNMFFNGLGLSFHAFTFICSLFCLTLLGFSFKEYSPYILLSLCLYVGSYFLYYNMIAMRQVLAISIILFAIKYIYKKEDYKFFISLAIASLFHTTALVFLPAYFFCKYFKLTIQSILILLTGAFLILVFIDPNVIMGFILGHSQVVNERMQFYLTPSDFAFSRIIRIATVLILIIVFYSKLKDDYYFQFFSKMFILYVFLYIIFHQWEILMRIWSYLDISTVIIIPILIKSIRNKYIKSLFYILFMGSAIISFQQVYKFDDGDMLKSTLFFLE